MLSGISLELGHKYHMTSLVCGMHKILIFLPVEWQLSKDEMGLEYGKEKTMVTVYKIAARCREQILVLHVVNNNVVYISKELKYHVLDNLTTKKS